MCLETFQNVASLSSCCGFSGKSENLKALTHSSFLTVQLATHLSWSREPLCILIPVSLPAPNASDQTNPMSEEGKCGMFKTLLSLPSVGERDCGENFYWIKGQGRKRNKTRAMLTFWADTTAPFHRSPGVEETLFVDRVYSKPYRDATLCLLLPLRPLNLSQTGICTNAHD